MSYGVVGNRNFLVTFDNVKLLPLSNVKPRTLVSKIWTRLMFKAKNIGVENYAAFQVVHEKSDVVEILNAEAHGGEAT